VLNNTQQLQTLAKDQSNAADQHGGAPDHDKQGE
jgi:type VI secretion system protein ImpB